MPKNCTIIILYLDLEIRWKLHGKLVVVRKGQHTQTWLFHCLHKMIKIIINQSLICLTNISLLVADIINADRDKNENLSMINPINYLFVN
jgi:hypothetical protein